MLSYITRRLVLTLPVLFGVATLVFSLIHMVPGDPAQAKALVDRLGADIERIS